MNLSGYDQAILRELLDHLVDTGYEFESDQIDDWVTDMLERLENKEAV